MLPLEIFIAWRYLQARRKGVFTFLTTLISIGGITLGVAALIITLAVMSGFHRDIQEKILGLQPHLIITRGDNSPFYNYDKIQEKVKGIPGIIATAPFIYGQVILRGSYASIGIVVKGISWQSEENVIHLSRNIVNKDSFGNNLLEKEILLGKELVKQINVNIGEDIILLTPDQTGLIPKMGKFTVKGIFNSGMYEYDTSLGYISLESAQKLFGLNSTVTGIGVAVSNPVKADRFANILRKDLGYPYVIRSWNEMNRNLFAALKLEKIMMFLILALIILVAAFNIISNLILLTVEKSKEIGILSAIGLSRNQIGRIFLYEGLIMGTLGTFLGSILGIGISILLSKYRFIHLPSDIYYIDTLPVKIIPLDVISVIFVTLIITILAGLYPYYQVSKLDPIEAIRYG